jgi:hypothetical protein
MNKTSLRTLFTAAVLAVSAVSASAITIDPQFDTFGTLAGATFGGSGIPNTDVAITTVGGVTLGLSAAQRFSSPVVTDDNAGNFFAVAGSYGATNPTYAKWNFNYYIAGLSGGQTVALYYDLNPAVDNEVLTSFFPITSDTQNSLNLGMTSLFGTAFNASADGQYDFALVLFSNQGVEIGRSAISVNVGNVSSVPDSSATLGLLGLGLAGLVAVRRRFVK